ncbi:MAG TPA: hypothetical protein VFR76_08990 [Verrucomicrobiae bacterium]|nr:hypothetical protein [Verrucomicrobiae bacterium]
MAPLLVVALAGDHAFAAATVHPRKLTAVLLSRLRLGHLLHQALASARLVCPGLCRVQTARAKDLRAVPAAVVLCLHELVRRVYRLQAVQATRVLRLRRALPLLRAVAARPACLFRVQMGTAKRLTRAPVLLPARCDRLCHADQAYLPARDPRPLDLSREPAPGCPLRAPQHELAAEHSLDFRF